MSYEPKPLDPRPIHGTIDHYDVDVSTGTVTYHVVQTHGDRIRAMTDYDLADWIAKVLMYHGLAERHPYLNCDKNCPLYECCNDQPSDNIEDWLKSPADGVSNDA